nr:glycoside hydrolase family 95 protein [Maribellus maritimus]
MNINKCKRRLKSRSIKLVVIALGYLFVSCSGQKISAEPSGNTHWYKKPASEWFEAPPPGNGRLETIVFGGVNEDHLQLNEEIILLLTKHIRQKSRSLQIYWEIGKSNWMTRYHLQQIKYFHWNMTLWNLKKGEGLIDFNLNM